LNGAHPIAGYPRRIVDDWHPLPTSIDTVFTDRYEWTWATKGDRVWQIDASMDGRMRFFGAKPLRAAEPFVSYDYTHIDAVLSIPIDVDQPPVFFFLG
jgi:hypothetical protein